MWQYQAWELVELQVKSQVTLITDGQFDNAKIKG